MAKKHPLFRLIKSLNKSEKRYVRLFTGLQSKTGDNNYLQLFELIEKQSEYDEEKVKGKLRNKTFAKNLSSGKNYLYNLILKSLRNYYSEDSAFIKVRELEIDVRILQRRGLLEERTKRLAKAKKLAEKHQLQSELVSILMHERGIIRGFVNKKTNHLLSENFSEINDAVDKINSTVELLTLYDDIFLQIRSGKIDLNDGQAILDRLNFYKENLDLNALSKEGTFIYYLCWSFYYQDIDTDFENAGKYSRHLLDYMEKNPEMIEEAPTRYINIANNFLPMQLIRGDFELFPRYLQKLKEIPAKNSELKQKLFQTLSYLELLYSNERETFKEGIEKIPEIEKGLLLYKSKLPLLNFLVINQLIALHYFHDGQYDLCIDKLNEIAQIEKQDVRQDLILFALIVHMMIAYDQDNDDLLESLSRSIKFKLKDESTKINYLVGVSMALRKSYGQEVSKEKEILRNLKEEIDNMDGLLTGKQAITRWLKAKA